MTPTPEEIEKAIAWFEGIEFSGMPGTNARHGKTLAAALRQAEQERSMMDKERRWSNDQIQRLASVLGMPDGRSDEVIDVALIVIDAYKKLGVKMITKYIDEAVAKAKEYGNG